jgi:cell division protein FtsQ
LTQTRGWRLVVAQRAGRWSNPVGSSSARRFAKRARRRRLRAAAPWLVILGIVLLLGTGVAVVYTTPVLGVERVEVSGVAVLTPQTVRVAAGVRIGTPLARLDTGSVAARVRRLKPVHSVRVVRDFPHTLLISVQERTPVAVVPQGDGYTLLDAGGIAYLPVAAPPVGLPVVRLARPGPEDATTRAALTVLAALPPVLRVPMVELVADSPTRIRLELTDNRRIIWGDATENEAKVRVISSVQVGPDRTFDVSAPGVVTER